MGKENRILGQFMVNKHPLTSKFIMFFSFCIWRAAVKFFVKPISVLKKQYDSYTLTHN